MSFCPLGCVIDSIICCPALGSSRLALCLLAATAEQPPRGSRCGHSAVPARSAIGRPTGRASPRRTKPRPGAPATRLPTDSSAPWTSWNTGQDRCRRAASRDTSPGTTRRCSRACRAAPKRWRNTAKSRFQFVRRSVRWVWVDGGRYLFWLAKLSIVFLVYAG